MEGEYLFKISQSWDVSNQAIKYIIKVEGMAEWRQALTKNVSLGKIRQGEGKNKRRILKGSMLKDKSWLWQAV